MSQSLSPPRPPWPDPAAGPRSAEREIADTGYAVRPLLDDDAAARFLREFDDLAVPADSGVYRSFMDEPRSVARRVDRSLKDALRPLVEGILPGREIVLALYCFKGTSGPEVEYHQDWTFTDERSTRTIALWIPLVDVGPHNGGLEVLPGSHRWTRNIRTCAPDLESPIVPHQAAFGQLTLTPSLTAGTALLYDAATIHGSGPNRSGGGRPAIILQTVPTGTPIVHFRQDEERVEGFVVDESFFSTHEYQSRPEGFRSATAWTGPVSAEDFVAPVRDRLAPLHQGVPTSPRPAGPGALVRRGRRGAAAVGALGRRWVRRAGH